MKPDENVDDEFVHRLADYDESLAKRPSSISPTPLPAANGGENDARFEKAKSLLHLLESVWPRGANDDPSASPSNSQALPMDFGRFRLERELGRGGFGIVYEAFDPVLGRRIALKIPRPEVIAAAPLVDRFFQEARSAATLNHPNIVQVHDAGFIGLTCFIVSELCQGPNLSAWLQKPSARFNPRSAARLVAVLASAVAHAHAAGILHRDLKPSNVLLSSLGSANEHQPASDEALLGFVPKLSDFGLAKILESSSQHTPSGSLIGTPEYMAPEQAEGRVEDIGQATDIYGLGALLYELLSGHPPVQGTTDVDKLRRVVADQPEPIRRRRPEVPADLEAICNKCLEKEPSDRYESAAALADDLRRFLDGKPTIARPLSLMARGVRWSRKHVAESALAGLLFIFVGVAALAAWWVPKTLGVRPEIVEDLKRAAHEKALLEYVADMSEARQAFENADVDKCVARLTEYIPADGKEDLRGYEWRRLWYLTHAENATFDGFKDAVYHVDFSPDGKRLVACGADGVISLWDLQNHAPQWLPNPHLGEVNTVHFSPDGRWIASASDDATIQLRDAQGKLVRTLRGHKKGVTIVQFDRVGNRVFSGGKDGAVIGWSTDSGQVERTWPTAFGVIESVALAPDGKRLFFTAQRTIQVVEDVQSTDPPRKFAATEGQPTVVTVTPDGKQVIVVGQDRMVMVLDSASGATVRSWRAHGDWINDVAVTPDGRFCATASRDNTARVFNLADGRAVARITGHRGRVWGVAIDPSGTLLATAGNDRCVKLWTLSRAGGGPVLGEYRPEPLHLSVASDSKRLLVPFGNGRIDMWDMDQWRRVARWKADPMLTSAVFLPDGKSIATTSDENFLRIWAIKGDAIEQEQEYPINQPTNVAFSLDGKRAALGSRTGAVTFLDFSPRFRAISSQAHPRNGCSVVMSPDGTLVASYSYDASTIVWDPLNAAKVLELRKHRQHINSAAFSPDGRILATASGDTSIGLWAMPDGREIAVLHGHSDEATSVVFSPDGRTLLAAYRDGLVRLWNVATRQEIYSRPTELIDVSALSISRNQRYLTLVGRDPVTRAFQILLCEAATDDSLPSAANAAEHPQSP